MKKFKTLKTILTAATITLSAAFLAAPTQAAVTSTYGNTDYTTTYSISESYIRLAPGEYTYLTLQDNRGNFAYGTWLAYNESKVRLSQCGGNVTEVKAVSQEPCKTTVAAYVNGKKVDTCIVEIADTTLSIKAETDTITVGKTAKMKLVDSNGKEQKAHWISYNTDKATVDKYTGVVKGIKGGSQTTIAAYVNGNKVATLPVFIKHVQPNIPKNPVLECEKNPNSRYVTLQKAWEYGPIPGFNTFFQLLNKNLEGTTFNFNSWAEYRLAVNYYEMLTNDEDMEYRNDLESNGRGGYTFIVRSSSDNVKYTSGQKGTLNYIKKAYNALSSAGVKNKMNKKDAYKKIASYIANHNEYDYSYRFYDLSDIFDYQRSVCEGYAELVHVMCIQAGIQSEFSWGYTSNSTDGSSHIWNRVNLGGQSFYTDITWYDNEKGRFDTDYLLRTSLWSSHRKVKTYKLCEYPMWDK